MKKRMSYVARCKKKAKALPLKTRRKFMEAIWTGKTIGEAMKAAGIDDLEAATGIIELNLVEKRVLLPPEETR